MHRLSRRLLFAALATLAVATASPSWAADKLKVVTTFTILGDMASNVGGEHIALTTLVGPDGDAHVYEPTPADARALAQADLAIVNGLGFEGWLDRLVKASGYKGPVVVASDGISALKAEEDHDHDHDHEEHAEEAGHDHNHEDHVEAGHAGHDHGAFDPHAWQSLDNAVTYVDTITAALAQADPDNAATFYQNRADYVAEIEALDAEIREIVEGLPEDRRIVVTSHDAFQYFARDYGLTFLSPQGISTESEASAQDVARLIETIRAEGVSAVFFENIADTRLLEQIANETGATIGGTLYPGALSELDGPAPTYLDMMRHNATTLAQALNS